MMTEKTLAEVDNANASLPELQEETAATGIRHSCFTDEIYSQVEQLYTARSNHMELESQPSWRGPSYPRSNRREVTVPTIWRCWTASRLWSGKGAESCVSTSWLNSVARVRVRPFSRSTRCAICGTMPRSQPPNLAGSLRLSIS